MRAASMNLRSIGGLLSLALQRNMGAGSGIGGSRSWGGGAARAAISGLGSHRPVRTARGPARSPLPGEDRTAGRMRSVGADAAERAGIVVLRAASSSTLCVPYRELVCSWQ